MFGKNRKPVGYNLRVIVEDGCNIAPTYTEDFRVNISKIIRDGIVICSSDGNHTYYPPNRIVRIEIKEVNN